MDGTGAANAAHFPEPRGDRIVDITRIAALFAYFRTGVCVSIEDCTIKFPICIFVWEEDSHSLQLASEVFFVVAQRTLGKGSCDHCGFL